MLERLGASQPRKNDKVGLPEKLDDHNTYSIFGGRYHLIGTNFPYPGLRRILPSSATTSPLRTVTLANPKLVFQ